MIPIPNLSLDTSSSASAYSAPSVHFRGGNTGSFAVGHDATAATSPEPIPMIGMYILAGLLILTMLKR